MAIKVRVLRGVQAGLTGMSGLVALSSGVTACTAEQAPGDGSYASDESALTVSNPGTGVFTLLWDYSTPIGYSFAAKNSTDEYVRAGEKMTFAIPSHFLWQRLYPTLPVPDDLARLKQLSAKVKVVFVKDGVALTSITVATNGTFQGSQTYDLAVSTAQFTVAKKATGIRFELAISDAADATKKASVAANELSEVPVIGGSLPNKTALFDSNGGAMRQRVLEGGNPVAGANLSLAYTDWRAATLVDSGSIDRTIGNATSFGRFGSFQMAISGELEHEITYAVAIDGVWQAEQALKANAKSRLLPPFGRVAYEGLLPLPAGAQKLELYFHVKTFLVVDYNKFSNVGWRKYEQGARLLVREKWDNEHGAYADNYDFTTEKK
jgi:hypothetical protein